VNGQNVISPGGSVSGLRVFLTGASSGLGRAFARHYAGRGASLGLVARRADVLQTLCGELPGEHLALCADVGDRRLLQAAADRYLTRFGVPDIVIANAGVSTGTLTEIAADLDAFEAVLRTNLLGMVATFQPFVDAMRARGSGRLVGVASVAGVRGLPGAGAYSASKAAAIAYLESLRVELRGSGVRVVTLAPGYIATPMTAVNTYPMPFLLDADVAARRMARSISAGCSYAVVPWQMGMVAKLLRMLPDPLFDALFARAGRKARGLPL
jgi:short-subunit dehydrogenase